MSVYTRKGRLANSAAETLTVLLGAGASQSYGIPGTRRLTELIADLDDPKALIPYAEFHSNGMDVANDPTLVPAAHLIALALRGDYDNVNFELMLHAVESMQGYSAAATFDPKLKNIRPVLGAFTEISSRWQYLSNFPLLTRLRRSMLEAIVGIIATSQYGGGTSDAQSDRATFKRFFETLRSRFALRIFTLNYDTSVDECGSWEDGYRDGNSDGAEFSRTALLDAFEHPRHLLVHLHGSMLFGYKKRHVGMVKYADWHEAIDSYSKSRKPKPDISGELFEPAPIISGLRKSDKLNSTPYGFYFHTFGDSILQCPRLLVIGYGFNDPHINYWLSQHRTRHADANRRACVVNRETEKVMTSSGLRPKDAIVFKQGQQPQAIAGQHQGVGYSPTGIRVEKSFPLLAPFDDLVIKFLDGKPFPPRSSRSRAQLRSANNSV
jgi:hypothetical protein